MSTEKLYPSEFKEIYGKLTNGQTYVKNHEITAWDTAENIKAKCITCQEKNYYGPDHFGSRNCQSGCRSLAAGGINAHCSCSFCW